MEYKQKEYFINSKDNQYYKLLAVIDHEIKKSHSDGNYPMWGETLDKLKKELEAENGENITPWAYNMIIEVLLSYVPDEIKEKF